MKIANFVKSLLPSIERNTLLDTIDSTLVELTDYTLPAYSAALSANLFTDKYQPKSKWFIAKNKTYRSSGFPYSAALVPHIHAVLATMPVKLKWIRKQLEAERSTTLVSRGLSYQVASLIQLVSYAGFVSRYSRRFLLQTYCEEIPTYFARGDGSSLPTPFSPIELNKMDELFPGFLELIAIFGIPDNQLANKLGKIPDYIVDPDDDGSVISSGTDEALDPLNVGFIPHRYNPIFHARMAIADYQHSRYLSAKEESQSLSLRLLAMKQARDAGQDVDPATNEVIRKTEGRLRDLNYKIGKMEQL